MSNKIGSTLARLGSNKIIELKGDRLSVKSTKTSVTHLFAKIPVFGGHFANEIRARQINAKEKLRTLFYEMFGNLSKDTIDQIFDAEPGATVTLSQLGDLKTKAARFDRLAAGIAAKAKEDARTLATPPTTIPPNTPVILAAPPPSDPPPPSDSPPPPPPPLAHVEQNVKLQHGAEAPNLAAPPPPLDAPPPPFDAPPPAPLSPGSATGNLGAVSRIPIFVSQQLKASCSPDEMTKLQTKSVREIVHHFVRTRIAADPELSSKERDELTDFYTTINLDIPLKRMSGAEQTKFFGDLKASKSAMENDWRSFAAGAEIPTPFAREIVVTYAPITVEDHRGKGFAANMRLYILQRVEAIFGSEAHRNLAMNRPQDTALKDKLASLDWKASLSGLSDEDAVSMVDAVIRKEGAEILEKAQQTHPSQEPDWKLRAKETGLPTTVTRNFLTGYPETQAIELLKLPFNDAMGFYFSVRVPDDTNANTDRNGSRAIMHALSSMDWETLLKGKTDEEKTSTMEGLYKDALEFEPLADKLADLTGAPHFVTRSLVRNFPGGEPKQLGELPLGARLASTVTLYISDAVARRLPPAPGANGAKLTAQEKAGLEDFLMQVEWKSLLSGSPEDAAAHVDRIINEQIKMIGIDRQRN